MYAAGVEHAYKRPCRDILDLIRRGELPALTNTAVHQEILCRYLSQRQAARAREVSEDFQTLVPNVLPVELRDVALARELLAKHPRLSARDLIHLAVMLNNGIDTIISVDRDFDATAEVTRLDPAAI